MLDEGAKGRSAIDIADEISFLGAQLATTATWDSSHVTVSALSENLDKALAVWADVLLAPAFAEEELERVRDNLVAALARRKDSPPAVAQVTFGRVVFGDDHPYGWPDVGTEDTVKGFTVADLKKFYDAHYTPSNAVLVVAGDITEDEVRSRIGPLLAAWKPRAVAPERIARPPAPSKMRIYLVDKAGAPQSSILVGLVGLERRSPDFHRALVMNHILGGSFKRLFLNLREQKGWTYGARSFFDARRAPGPWIAGGEFVAKHTSDSVAEILKEVRAMRDTDVTDKELADTRDEIIKGFPARFATATQVAGQYAALAAHGLPDAELETFTKKIAAVTKADVRRMAQKYLVPERLSIVVVGDRKSHEEALKKIAEVELRDVEGAPLAKPTAALER
jgi:zinc protease